MVPVRFPPAESRWLREFRRYAAGTAMDNAGIALDLHIMHVMAMSLILIVALAIAGCSTNKAGPVRAAAPPAPVSISQAISKSLPLEIQSVGNAEAYSTVTVKAQIGGALIQAGFQRGAD